MCMQFRVFLMLLFFISLANCARVGRPSGGDKDLKPPISISATPDFGSTNFKEKKIKIYFDEYIKLKDVNKQLVVSPPLKYPPIIAPLGSASKYISVKIKDTLKENTTYTLNFGNAVVDNSEGNPLKQFKYLFSTGDYLDSLKVVGSVKNAFEQKKVKDISVFLYAVDSVFNDSIIYKRKPDYVGNTLDSLVFSITNIKEGKYLLVAVDDVNNNMKFDPRQDKIAFVDQLIDAELDTNYQLELFKELPRFALKNATELSKNHIVIGFEGKPEAAVEKLVDKRKKSVSFFSYRDRKTDTIHVWHKDVDTDTLHINFKEKDIHESIITRLRTKDRDSLQLTKSIRQTLALRDSLFIKSNIPIATLDKEKMELIDSDSLKIPFIVLLDPRQDKFRVSFDKEYDTRYTLTMMPKAVTDFLGHKNDTIKYAFSTNNPEDYGEVIIAIKNVKKESIALELFKSSGELVERNLIQESQTVKYISLKPGTYKLRAIYDKNNNGKWDTGNYLKKVQPEKVLYFSKEIEVRANWSINEDFIIK